MSAQALTLAAALLLGAAPPATDAPLRLAQGAQQQEAAQPEAAAPAQDEAAAQAEEPPKPAGVGVDELVRRALGGSGLVQEAQGKVQEWRGRLAEVESLYYPKLSARGYLAPMYRVRGSDANAHLQEELDTDWGEWGPYTHLEATLAQPLYTFGRLSKGKQAAEARVAVEEAAVRVTRNTLALEVRKMYYLHLFARSMKPALRNGQKLLETARKEARKLYDEGEGKVTQIDLAKLEYGASEIEKYIVQAEMGEALTLAALKHMAAMPQDAELVVADEALPPPPEDALPELAQLIATASAERPEWAQVRHGKVAALSLEQAERLANAPIVFAAGQLRADWTPMRPDVKNPFARDDYNGVFGGVAVGLQWDLDPWKAKARGDQAKGIGQQVAGLEKFAASGIPVEVRKAHDDVVQAQKMVELSERGSTAARKWMTFAGSAYLAGTGEAKDVLEGVVAHLQSRKGYFEALQQLHTARANILYVTGRTGLEAPAPAAGTTPAQ